MPLNLVKRFFEVKNEEGLGSALQSTRSFILSRPRRLFLRGYYPLNQKVFHRRYGYPTNVMEQDWDNLLILDACRYDLFSQYNSIEGELDSIVSVSSTSKEFMWNTFSGKTYHDTVCVSANAYSHDLEDGIFYKFVSTYSKKYRDVRDGRLYQNYAPETVCDKALETYEKHPDKRLIVHFMQPHAPYFGKKAEKLRSRVRSDHDVGFSAWNLDSETSNNTDDIVYLMDAAKKGYITAEELKEVYVENLKLIIDHLEDLLESLDGKTVITSDHGELLGETNRLYNRLSGENYEHPGFVWIPELRIVLWLTIDTGKRRDIVSESPVTSEIVGQDLVDEHLKALGYKT